MSDRARALAVRAGVALKLIGGPRRGPRDDHEDEWAGAHAAPVGYGESCDRDHRAAPEAPARPGPALELELSLFDDHDRVRQATRLQATPEPGRNSEDAPGEPGRERTAKERAAGALVHGHRRVAGRPKAGKSSGKRKKCMSATRPDSIPTTWIPNALAPAPS